jgi:hypothetical protein
MAGNSHYPDPMSSLDELVLASVNEVSGEAYSEAWVDEPSGDLDDCMASWMGDECPCASCVEDRLIYGVEDD